MSTRFLDPLVECLEQLARFLGFLLGKIVPLSHVLIQTIKFGLVLIHPVDETELYRLDEDVGERNDLAKKEPEKARELLQTLNQWVKETGRH
jgi:hypothetical protein